MPACCIAPSVQCTQFATETAASQSLCVCSYYDQTTACPLTAPYTGYANRNLTQVCTLHVVAASVVVSCAGSSWTYRIATTAGQLISLPGQCMTAANHAARAVLRPGTNSMHMQHQRHTHKTACRPALPAADGWQQPGSTDSHRVLQQRLQHQPAARLSSHSHLCTRSWTIHGTLSRPLSNPCRLCSRAQAAVSSTRTNFGQRMTCNSGRELR